MAKSFIINSFPPQQDHHQLYDQFFYRHGQWKAEPSSLMDSSPPRGNFQFQLSNIHDLDHKRPDEMDFFACKRDDHDQSKVTDNASDGDDRRGFSRSADLDFNVNVILLNFFTFLLIARGIPFCNELTNLCTDWSASSHGKHL